MARTGQQMRMRTTKAMARGRTSSVRGAPTQGSRRGDRLRYRFDNSVERGTPALVAWLSGVTLLLILVFAVATTILGLRDDPDANFFDELFQRRGETAIGYKSDALGGDDVAGFGVVVNPAKSRTFSVLPGDRVVVLAES